MPGFLTIFTIVHVAISLLAIAAGFYVMYGLVTSKHSSRWTKFFLLMTVLTSVTGFGFPVEKIMPAHILGVLSLLALGPAIYALYPRKLAGPWRIVYLVTAIISQYLNVFVLIVQSFLKISPLHALAPTQAEWPFAVAQGVTLVAFVAFTIFAIMRFRPSAGAVGEKVTTVL